MMRHPSVTAASLLVAALLMLAAAPAQAQVALGRLFATPAERAAMEANRGAAAAPAQNPDGMQPPPGMPADPAGQEAAATPAPPPPPPPSLVMSGVLRRSGSRDTTVWLNGEPQYGAQKNLSQRKGAATPNLTVTLPSGKRVTLKPGQRYDLNEGRVKDINEP